MNPDELKKIDLNLLVTFNALMDERNVSRAAERMQVTQPAMSRTLQRLRDLFKDPLFIRTPKGLDPTARSLELQQPVSLVLDQLVSILTPTRLDLKSLTRTFTLAMPDPVAALLIPALVKKLETLAPQVRLKLRGYTGDSLGLLSQGTLDFVAGVITDNTPVGIHARTLFQDHMVCMMRNEHPLALKGTLTLEELLSYDHLKPWFKGINDKGVLDAKLQEIGVSRFIRVESAHSLATIRILQGSDAICLGLASWQSMLGIGALTSVAVPDLFALNKAEFHLLWDERNHKDPASQWLRQQLVDIAAEECGEKTKV